MKNLLKRLKISHKLTIICVLFMIPIVVLLGILINTNDNNIDSYVKESHGLVVLTPLNKLMQLVSDNMLLNFTLYANKDNSEYQNLLNSSATNIDHSFKSLFEEMRMYEKELKLSNDDFNKSNLTELTYDNLYSIWEKIQNSKQTYSRNKLFHEYNLLLINLSRLNSYISDKSNLVLEKDIDAYYLMNIGLLILPDEYINLNELINNGINCYTSKIEYNENKIRLYYLINILNDSYIHRIERGINIATAENSNNTPLSRLRLYYFNFKSRINEFCEYNKLLVDSSNLNQTSLVEYVKLSRKTIYASDMFASQVIDILNNLLYQRILNARTNRNIGISIISFGFILVLILVVIISKGITKPINLLTDIATDYAKGNIIIATNKLEKIKSTKYFKDIETTNKGRNDEITGLFFAVNEMVYSLNNLVEIIKKSVIQLSSSANIITTSAQDIETTVIEQASGINQINSTIKEITASFNELSGTMNNLTQLAVETSNIANASMIYLSEINNSMNLLFDSSSNISEKLNSISNKTSNITEVITTITKVANQTNLLSLNAAIEAEKAGEYGVGFSVVAREIRRLADQTSVATLNIEETVSMMQNAVKDGVSYVEEYSKFTLDNSQSISSMSLELNELIEKTRDFEPKFQSVNDSMQMQAQASDQINFAMTQLNQTANQNRDLLVEFNNVTDILNSAVGELQNEILKFNTSELKNDN